MHVRITPNTRQKYVLVRAGRLGEEILLLWGNPDIQWHNDIVREITEVGYDSIEPLGGGWLFSRPEERVVYVWGKSDHLGEAPISLVREVLDEEVIEGEPE